MLGKIVSRLFIYAITASVLASCSGVNFQQWHFPYMMEVQQGNYVSEAQFKQLRAGLSKEQVQDVIGHPLTTYLFNKNRWDFIYQDYHNNSLGKNYNISLFFTNNLVTTIDKHGDLF